MGITEKLKETILPALIVIGIGILEIKFPHAMDGFDDNYTGRGGAGFILLLFELFLRLTWGKIGGIIAILLGILAIVTCWVPKSEQVEAKPTRSVITESEQVEAKPTPSLITEDNKRLTNHRLTSLALRAGKTYVQRKLHNRKP